MDALDDSLKAVLRFIEKFYNAHTSWPTYEEIRAGTEMSSKDRAHRLVKKLIARQYVRTNPKMTRGIILMRTADGYLVTANGYSIPWFGYVTAGSPIPLPDANALPLDWVEVTRKMLEEANADTEGVYALTVRGDSMIDALVNDSDKVVVRKQSTAKDGEMVIARIKKDPTNIVTTLKRLYRRNGTVWLQPENPTLQPVPFKSDEIEIQAIVITVIRNVSENGVRNLRVN